MGEKKKDNSNMNDLDGSCVPDGDIRDRTGIPDTDFHIYGSV